MRISRRAEYAVRAVLDMALQAPAEDGVRAREIAARTGVPEKFLKAILNELGEAGIVVSRRGPRGGHRLAPETPRLTVGDVLRAVDGPLSDGALSPGGQTSAADAALRRVFNRVDEAVLGVVNSVTFEDLRRQAGRHAPVDFAI
jgi:Rrf2 family transcriptional regulator, iron-sulfur cluster assembly transcription factor